jgi:thermostable 8-oxoguanine DNA glycosylase
MYESNDPIDNPDNDWTPGAVERLFIFCQFDRAMPYEKVCESYRYLESHGFLSFEILRTFTVGELTDLLRDARLRFPKVTATYLYRNIREFNGEKLKKMSRDEIVEKCSGFGYKLASMFCNRCQGTQYAIIDVHIDRYIKEHWFKSGIIAPSLTYKEKEKCFIELAKQQGKTPDELDWEIWDSRRIGSKKEKA